MRNDVLPLENIWLADDDSDDRQLFEDAIRELLPSVTVTGITDGEKLMDLFEAGTVPDMLFLDLNMPCKNGIDCIKEIREERKMDKLPIIAF